MEYRVATGAATVYFQPGGMCNIYIIPALIASKKALFYRCAKIVEHENCRVSMANCQIGLSAVVFEVLIPLPECATSLSYSFI